MVADADEVETSVVREASMPDHLAHLVDTDLQPEAEENFVAVSHETHSIRSTSVSPWCLMETRTAHPGQA